MKRRAGWAAIASATTIGMACASSQQTGGSGSPHDDGGGASDASQAVDATGSDARSGGSDSGGFGPLGDATPADAFVGCATTTQKATQLPLDLYFMMDTSGSMDDLVSASQSKWQAVVSAMTTFVGDQASAGIGMGLQYFPVPKAGVPASCTSSAQCNGAGPCLQSICNLEAAQGLD